MPLGFSCMSSLHSLSEAGGDSARSGKSSLVLGPRKRILSRRFSMVNTAHLGFTLTWRTATLWGHKTEFIVGKAVWKITFFSSELIET